MSKNYDDYEYEEENNTKDSSLLKKILVILLITIAAIIIVCLLRGCNKKENIEEKPKVVTNDIKYEDELIKGAKKYFETNDEKMPQARGECTNVTLSELLEKKYVDSASFTNCETKKTYIRVCILSNGSKHYTPWLTCSDRKSEQEYGELKVGTLNDVISNQSYVEFKFLPKVLKSEESSLGNVEELWKDDIKYTAYKTLQTTNYYRYQDTLYKWNLYTNYYFSTKGETSDSNSIYEYYETTPNKDYANKDNGIEAYKWYKKEYKLGNNDAKEFFAETCPVDYPYTGEVTPVTRYFRADESSTLGNKNIFYKCASTPDGENSAIIYTPYKCSERPVSDSSKEKYKYEVGFIYSCASGTSTEESILMQKVDKDGKCYSKWSDASEEYCDASKDNCRSVTVDFKTCYRRRYYKSNSLNAKDEITYYSTAPEENTYKDENTKTTVYKWYRVDKKTTSDYSTTAPNANLYSKVEKTNDKPKKTDWSDWSTTKQKAGSGVERNFETKTKIKLQQILDSQNAGWSDLSSNYVTQDEMMKLLKNNKYEVNSLTDIENNGEIQYLTQMYIRNKKINITVK